MVANRPITAGAAVKVRTGTIANGSWVGVVGGCGGWGEVGWGGGMRGAGGREAAVISWW